MKHTNGLLRFAALLMTAVVLLSMIPALSASAADRTCFLLDLSLPDATAFSLSG